jgi:Leucine-rich repeat (LRR) protein
MNLPPTRPGSAPTFSHNFYHNNVPARTPPPRSASTRTPPPSSPLCKELPIEDPSMKELTLDDSTSRNVLNLSAKDLREFSTQSIPFEKVIRLYALVEVDISGNFLRELFINFDPFKSLKILDVSYNQLTHLPKSIGSCATLTCLTADHNNLVDIPESLSSLVQLEDLSLFANKFSDFPFNERRFPQQTLLPSLRALDLSSNEMLSIDSGIQKLPSLTALNLSRNRLTSISALCFSTIRDQVTPSLAELEYLNLSHNHLQDIPSPLYQLPYLCHIRLNGNPLERLSLPALKPNLTIYLNTIQSCKFREEIDKALSRQDSPHIGIIQ